MTSAIKTMLLAAVVLIPATLTVPSASAQNRREKFLVSNESDYRIDHIYVSPHSSRVWGPDQLGDQVLLPNYHIGLYFDPGTYDVRIVDRDGDACVLANVDFYDGTTYHITDTALLACELLTR